ncbi:hypothetical protein MARPU_07225 [Marichromatium purpuratum 984]|uniref:beta-lactamase n=1 Tax=Marichromatium purpuratum 984 TaxID=765910 RepID=W0DYL3_MARPU|nr:serine hydrolase [Marichromatium purpuratum]AHF03675.1 hypothetical protein MARPU_07225 [Marichromatium purpuratum 984]
MYEFADGIEQPAADDNGFFLDRRNFLAALAATSAGLLGGSPSFVEAAARDHSLNHQVNDLVQRLRRKGVVRSNEQTSWSVYDFSTGKKLVAINEDVQRQAASMIKPFVAQAYFYQATHSRRVRYNDDVRHHMERMIQRSSNSATNWLIDRVSANRGRRGPRDVEAELKQHAPGIFRQTRIIEKIPPGGGTYANKASAHDYSRFLYAIWNDRLPYSAELRRLMCLPNNDRIVTRVSAISHPLQVCDKTGSTAKLCGNMGIIEARDRRGRKHAYTMIGIIERPTRAQNYTQWIRSRGDVIRQVSNLVYLHMKDRHGLV